jgi:hypothetical protein
MNDQIETAVEQSAIEINLNSPVGLAITFLAVYGAKAVTSDVRRGLKKIRENRKAKTETEQADQPAASEQA